MTWEWERLFSLREWRQDWELQNLSVVRLLRLYQEYETGRLPLYHFDVYRIGDIEEMEEIGYDDYFFGKGICLIEWANLIEEILPENLIQITIEKDLEGGFDYRRITVTGLE